MSHPLLLFVLSLWQRQTYKKKWDGREPFPLVWNCQHKQHIDLWQIVQFVGDTTWNSTRQHVTQIWTLSNTMTNLLSQLATEFFITRRITWRLMSRWKLGRLQLAKKDVRTWDKKISNSSYGWRRRFWIGNLRVDKSLASADGRYLA